MSSRGACCHIGYRFSYFIFVVLVWVTFLKIWQHWALYFLLEKNKGDIRYVSYLIGMFLDTWDESSEHLLHLIFWSIFTFDRVSQLLALLPVMIRRTKKRTFRGKPSFLGHFLFLPEFCPEGFATPTRRLLFTWLGCAQRLSVCADWASYFIELLVISLHFQV